MTRNQIYKEIEDLLGRVPTFLKELPDSSLETQWRTMRQLELEEGPIPSRYRELIGLGVAAAMKCRYCAAFHTEAAKVHGATDDEIKDAVRFASNSAMWSTWLNGLQFDFDQFQKEVHEIGQHLRAAAPVK